MAEIEYMRNTNFNGDKSQSLKDMELVIKNSNTSSRANIHLAFLNNCGGGVAGAVETICKPKEHKNLAINCMLQSRKIFLWYSL